MPSRTAEKIQTHTGRAPEEARFGELILNRFDSSRGLENITLPEHAIFFLQSPTQTTDTWQGERHPPRDWKAGDVQFLPRCSTLQTSVTQEPYTETLIRIPSELIDRACADFEIQSPCLRYASIQPVKMFGLASAIIEAVKAPDPPPALLVDALTIAMASSVAAAATGAQAPTHQSNARKIKRAIDYIEANLSQDLRLEDIASAAAMSPFHFARAFKDAVGTTPMRHVWARRVAMSQCMMRREPSMPLAHVALACGFANQSSFTTRFREIVGVTPDKFRKG